VTSVDVPQPVIEHVLPPRDSSGPTPRRYEWTPVDGADRYSVGLWNDAGGLVWRQANIRETAVEWPPDMTLDLGTYFWSVAAFRGDQPPAGSSLAAFVVSR
jgi:hypothetical protein